jgi:hypothetical protein
VIELGLIFEQARGLGVDLGSLPDAITKNETPDAARKRMFDELAKKSKDGGPRGGGSGNDRAEIVRDEREGVAESMQLALVNRLLQSRGSSMAINYEPKGNSQHAVRERQWLEQHRKQSEQYMGMGLVEMAAQSIGYRGRNNFLTAWDANVIFERAFNTTSDFPSIFMNALNKALLARYQLHMPTYREIAAERTFVDFRPSPAGPCR